MIDKIFAFAKCKFLVLKAILIHDFKIFGFEIDEGDIFDKGFSADEFGDVSLNIGPCVILPEVLLEAKIMFYLFEF